MLADQFMSAAASARTSAALDELARLTWRAHAEGAMSDAGAEAVSEALQARRKAFATRRAFPPARPARAARRHPRSPDRAQSIERRRRQASSGAMPPMLAARFTVGEQSVLAVVAREMQKRQACVLCVDAIAALAGVSRRTAQSAMRAAEAIG
jgi:hypothetical protein